MKTYTPGGRHVGSSGFTNYIGGAPDPLQALAECTDEVGEPCALINGSDDWYQPTWRRPERWFPRELAVARYHSGISGISTTGRIFRLKDLAAVEASFAACSDEVKPKQTPKPADLAVAVASGGLRFLKYQYGEAVEEYP